MTWSPQHILDVIALIFAVISGGAVVIPPEANVRLAPGLLVVAVILLAVAGLVG